MPPTYNPDVTDSGIVPALVRGSATEESPFIWQSKAALQRIENSSNIKDFANAKLVYVALTWIASDKGQETFTCEIALIARKTSMSYRTVQPVLDELEQSGLIRIKRPVGIRAACEYTLLSFGKSCTTNGENCRTFGKRSDTLIADNSNKDRRTEREIIYPTLEQAKTEAQLRGIPDAQAEEFWHHFESSGWVDKNGNAIVNWQSKLMTWATNAKSKSLERAHHAKEQGPRPSGKPAGSVYELKQVLDAKEKLANDLKNRYFSETPLGGSWESEEKRVEFVRLRKEIKELRSKLAGMA